MKMIPAAGPGPEKGADLRQDMFERQEKSERQEMSNWQQKKRISDNSRRH